MRTAERRLADRQCPLVQGLGFAVATLTVIEKGELLERVGQLRTIRTRLLRDRQRALEQWLGFAETKLSLVEHPQPGNGSGELDVLLTALLARQRDEPLSERDRLGILAGAIKCLNLPVELFEGVVFCELYRSMPPGPALPR
jgi:hypothetical protein